MKHSVPCRAIASLLAALLSLAPALRASAAGKPRPGVALVPYAALPGVPEATAAKVSELIAQELRSRDDLRVVPVAAPVRVDPAAERTQADAAATQARAGLARATELAGKGKHAQAAEALQKAIAQLSARPLAVDDAGGPLLADAALQLAVERLVAGDEDGGDAALSLLVRLAPERSVAAADYPPAFLSELSGVRKRLLAGPRGSLRVLPPAGGGDSRVLLDGRVLRGAPLVIKDVLPGEHFVRVERGSQAFASKVVVVAGVETPVAAGASELGAQLVQGTIDRGAAASAARLAKAAGAQAALFGAVVKTPEGLSVRTFLAFAKGERVVALWPMVVDAELLGASVQVLRLADDTAAKLDGKSPEAALPIALGGTLEGTPPVPEVQGAPPPPPAEAEAALPIAPLVPETKPAAPAVSAAPAPAATQPAAAQPAAPMPSAAASSADAAKPPASAPTPSTSAATPSAAASSSSAPVSTADDARRVAVPGAAVTAAPPPPAAAEAPAPAARAAADPPSRRLVVPREPSADAPDTSTAVPQAAAQAAPQPTTHRLEALEPEAIKTARETPPEKKNHTVLWIITGVLVAGAAAAGGYFLYESGQSPSTATVNAGWSK